MSVNIMDVSPTHLRGSRECTSISLSKEDTNASSHCCRELTSFCRRAREDIKFLSPIRADNGNVWYGVRRKASVKELSTLLFCTKAGIAITSAQFDQNWLLYIIFYVKC